MTISQAVSDLEVKYIDAQPTTKQKVSSFYQGGQVGIIVDLFSQLEIEKQMVLLHFLAGSFGFYLKEKQQ